MFAKVKKIPKPLRKQDFYLPNGEKVKPDDRFRGWGRWQFQYLSIWSLNELAKEGSLIIRARVELKAELLRKFREGKDVRTETWHLASILNRDVADQQKRELFWQKVEKKLGSFELSEEELKKIREKIEADVPKP